MWQRHYLSRAALVVTMTEYYDGERRRHRGRRPVSGSVTVREGSNNHGPNPDQSDTREIPGLR